MPELFLSAPPQLSPGKRAVLAALIECPEATVITIADAAQVGRSSAAASLTTLERLGLATRRPGALGDTVHRPPDLWSATAAATAAAAATVAMTTSPEPDSGTTTEAALRRVMDKDQAQPEKTDPADDTPALKPAAAAGTPSADSPERLGERLGKGMLRDAVRRQLHVDPEAAFTPTALSKVLLRSSGAISNALDALVASGEASMVREKPRTFRAKIPA